MPVAVALKRLVTDRELFAFWFIAFFFLSRLFMLTAGTLTALHRVTTAAGREGRTNACVAHAANTAKRKHRMVCEDLSERSEGCFIVRGTFLLDRKDTIILIYLSISG